MGELALLPGMVLAAALCAGGAANAVEAALFGLSSTERSRAGRRVERLLAAPRELLATLGLCSVGAFLVSMSAALNLFEAVSPARAALGVGGALVLHLCLAVVAPRTVGAASRRWLAPRAAPWVLFAVEVLAPLRARVLRVVASLGRRLGARVQTEQRLGATELAAVMEQTAASGALAGGDLDLVPQIVELRGVRVREIMTPRVDCSFLERRDAAVDRAVRAAMERRLSWLVVVDGGPDRVVGVVRARDLLRRRGGPWQKQILPAVFVPEVASALDLLRTLRRTSQAEAVVVDEWGGTAGVVHLENVFEEIVGDLRVEGESRQRAVIPQGEGVYRVAGSLGVRDWNQAFGHRVVPGEFETVGGFVTALLGRVPRVGDRVRWGELVLEVHEAKRRRVVWVDTWVAGPDEQQREERR